MPESVQARLVELVPIRDGRRRTFLKPYHLLMQDRKAAWDAFKESEDGVLVCTDIASRGLDDVDVCCGVHFPELDVTA